MLARFNGLPITSCVVVLCAALLPTPAAADPPDAKQVTLTLSGNPDTGYQITVDPESAEISRAKKAKIKKVYWAATANQHHPELFWELRWDPDKSGATEDYFGDVDLACGTDSLKVQPDKPKIPNAQWPYAVTVFSCVDGAKGEQLATVDPRIVWKD